MAKKFLTPTNFVNLESNPETGNAGDIYYNTSSNKFKYYNGTSWQDIGSGSGGSGITVSETAPSSPSEGDAWFKESTNSFYIYDGEYWIEVATTIILESGVTSLSGTANEIDVSASSGAVVLSLPATINAATTGNAATATSLQTSRTIALSGDVTGSASFDGSASVGISSTLANSGVSASTYGSATNIPILTVDAKGRITSASVAEVEGLPDQTGNNGKYLTTDGTEASWATVSGGGGGATGGGTDEIFWQNGQTVTTNYTITNNKNAGTFGPIQINSGVTVEIPIGSVWVIV